MTDKNENPDPADISPDMSFEDALAALEAIVERLERGEVSLGDAVAAYEKGSRLKDACRKRLDEARLKVEQVRAPRGASEADGVAAFDTAAGGDSKE